VVALGALHRRQRQGAAVPACGFGVFTWKIALAALLITGGALLASKEMLRRRHPSPG